MIVGRGNPESQTLLLGEKPGRDELRFGRVFVGRTGVELDKILWKTGISTDDIWIDNLLADTPTGEDWSVSDADIGRNQAHINELLAVGRFDRIVAMGAVASRYVLSSTDDNHVRSDIYTIHAIPHQTDTHDVFPTIHPAAGFHDADAYPYIFNDFYLAAAWIKGNWCGPDRVDRVGEAVRYTPLNDKDCSLIRQLFKRKPYTHIFIDTEGKVAAPWCLSFSLEEGEGYVIRSQHKAAIQQLAACCRDAGIVVVCHYTVHDIPVLRALGWDIIGDAAANAPDVVLDTMVAAYLLQIEPQGLKNLAYRHCGMLMHDYISLVEPYSLDQRIDWLLKLADTDWGQPEPVLVEKKNSTKLTQPQGLNRRINGIIRDLENNGDSVDVYKRWNAISPVVRGPAENIHGELPAATLDDVPFEEAFKYAARDADATGRVFWRLVEKLQHLELYDTFVMDCRCIPMIEEMQTIGFKTDVGYFKQLAVEWRGEQGKIRKELAEKHLGGRYINPESAPQVRKILFEEMGLPVFKETETGLASTGDKAIDWLKDKHPVVGLIARHREYDKGVTSFAEPIIRYASTDTDSRIHTNLKYTRVVSGRFSASDPNLLAMPVRSDLGKKIRAGFVAADGCLLGSWDLNQIEMRFMAHESQDEDLIAAYQRNADIHKETAQRMFGTKIEEVTDEQREVAKRISFGVITGITGQGLRDQFYLNGITKYSAADCDEFIRIWFAARPRVKNYLESCRAEARRFGWVRESVGGRIRYLQAIQSTDKRVMAEAERASHSHRISAGAQAVLKIAMPTLWPIVEELRRVDGVWIKWILQVHDELIFEFPEGYEEVLDTIITDVLCNTVKLRVPIKAKGKWAKNWGKLK